MRPVISKYLVEKHFSLNAHHYENVTPVQHHMARHLILLLRSHCLNYPVKSILELGCGTGRLTRLLLQLYPACKIVAIDISKEMISQTRRCLPAKSDVELIVGDAEVLVAKKAICSRQFDLVISNATVQWFNTPYDTLKRYDSLLSEYGMLAFSTFGPKTFFELRDAFYRAEKSLGISHRHHILRFVTPVDWKTLVDGNHKRRFFAKEKLHLETFPSVTNFLYGIKQMGATSPYSRKSSFIGPRLFRRMVEEYEKHHSTIDHRKINATFHLVYGLSHPHMQ